MANEEHLLLKNGYLVDGTGNPGFKGDLLINGKHIETISTEPIESECRTIDCSGKVIAPGFIDMHSHMDWILPIPGREDLKSPFTAQGCTTMVTGNCGFSSIGIKEDSQFRDLISLGGDSHHAITWHELEGFVDHLDLTGLSHNMITQVGHGTTRASVRGFSADPMARDEMKEMLGLLEESLDQGAIGVSFGLGYEPGIFASKEEITEVARLVAKKDKLITVHGRAYSAVSGAFGVTDGSTPHNVLSLQEMIDIALETGVRVQYSHLMFAGSKSHHTYHQCLDVLDDARRKGADIMTDTYPYHCGNSVINVILSPWFLAELPANYSNTNALARLEGEMTLMSEILGFGFDDIQISNANHSELDQFNGLFISEISEELGMSPFEVVMKFSKMTSGRAGVLNHNYGNMEITDALIKHPDCLFMTDTVVSPAGGVQNPATYGTFPLFLQYARDRKLLSLEDAVHKMTGASADRFQLKDRGFLRKGLAADITVFDKDAIKDNCTVNSTDQSPDGIEAVFINGQQVQSQGQVDGGISAGQVVQ
jgi:N-acyl-D-amino-acid deacylase